MRPKLFLFLLALMLAANSSHAAEPVTKFFLGANAVSFDGVNRFPSDFEIGGTARASLSPHLSGVGSAFYGISHTYLRGSVGARVTATDVSDPNFSIGVGIQYQVSNDETVRANEWTPDLSLGWKPYPETVPKLIIGAQSGWGLTSKQVFLMGAVRWELGAI